MEDKKYRLRYLPLFEQDFVQGVAYIAENEMLEENGIAPLGSDPSLQ